MATNPGRITQGTDFNFWERVSGITNTEYGVDSDGYAADIFFRFRGAPKNMILTLEGSTTVFYSFNGRADHGELITSTDRSQVIFTNRPASKIWFRVASGTGAVTVEAWAAV